MSDYKVVEEESSKAADDAFLRIQNAFPDHKIELLKETNLMDWIPRLSILVDGHKLKANWNHEAMVELRLYHGIKAEEEIASAMIEEIKQHLTMKTK